MSVSTAPTRLTTGSVPKHLQRLFIPMVIGVFAMISVNLVDTYFVGLLGTKELAAMSFTFPVVGLMINLCMGLGIGVTSTVARLIGAGNQAQANQVAGHAILMAVVLSGSLTLLGLITHDMIFSFIGASQELLVLLFAYMRWWFIGLPFLVTVIVANGVLRASGDSKTPMRLMLVVAGMNIILDPILIFGYCGVPKLGLEGAAIATMLARITTFSVTMYLLTKQGVLSVQNLNPRGLTHSLKEVIKVGIPAALTNALSPFSAGLMTALIALYGSEAIAGYGLAIRLEGLFLLVPMVMGGALSPFIGQNWGAHFTHRVVESLSFARRVSLIWGVLIWVLVELSAPTLAVAMSDDPKVCESFILYLRIVSVSYALQGVIYAANATFNAINRPIRATLISTMNSLLLALPLAYLGHMNYGLMGIMSGLLVARLVTGIVAHQWVWGLFDEGNKVVALSDAEVKRALYQLEDALPHLAVSLEKLISHLSQYPHLEMSHGQEGRFAYYLHDREIAHLSKNGTFEVRLPPELRDAVVRQGWGEHHGREYDAGWVIHRLQNAEDVEELERLIRLSYAYLICAYHPVPITEALSEIGKLCVVSRAFEVDDQLRQQRPPQPIFDALVQAISNFRMNHPEVEVTHA